MQKRIDAQRYPRIEGELDDGDAQRGGRHATGSAATSRSAA